MAHNDNDNDEKQDDEAFRGGGSRSKRKKNKQKLLGSEKSAPMEKQVIELKRRYPDVLLAVGTIILHHHFNYHHHGWLSFVLSASCLFVPSK
mmetsp:Transcript_22381/g.31318  ORF Transcript_22381/g.31318 Transcript_22381/m.31318 type:complete len:92 (-) Transcript_22381:603-878(-)